MLNKEVKKNKKAMLGGETIIWIYRFILLGLVVFVFVFAVSHFYSAKYDIRPIGTALLSKRIIGCITNNSIIMLDKFNFDDITECAGLSDDMIKESYIKAIIESKEVKPGEETELERETEGNAEEDKLSESFNIGDNILGDLCFIEGKYVPFCLSQQYYVLVKKNNKLERAKLNLLIALGTEFGGGRFEQTRS